MFIEFNYCKLNKIFIAMIFLTTAVSELNESCYLPGQRAGSKGP